VTTNLEQALYRIQRIDPVHTKPAAVDYGMFDISIVQKQIDRLWTSIANYADVETPSARTTVAWKGDFTTTLTTTHNIDQHQQALESALTRRLTILRIVAASLGVASGIAAASADPLASLSAMSAARKLVQELRNID